MRALTLTLCFLLMLPAGCGGGNNASNSTAGEEVDLTSPEGAIAAYRYAIIKLDETVAEQVFSTEDKELLMKSFRENKRKSANENVTFDVEVSEAFQVKENVIVAEVTYIKKDASGKPVGTPQKNWGAWVKEADNLWRYNHTAATEYRALVAEQERNRAPSNEPVPAPGNEPASNQDG